MREDRQEDIRRAMKHFCERVNTDWRAAVIAMVGSWPLAKLHRPDRPDYRLIGGEAMDWQQVARLSCAMNSKTPARHKLERWLLNSDMHGDVGEAEFIRCLGKERYKAHLNFFYGVKIERAARAVVLRDLIKSTRASGGNPNRSTYEQSYRELYDLDYTTLKSGFRQDLEERSLQGIDPDEIKAEFAYWLFKFRLNNLPRARVASGTKRGLDWWYAQQTDGVKYTISPADIPYSELKPMEASRS